MSQLQKRTVARNRVRQDQLNMLVSYMECHSEFARGQRAKLGAAGNLKFIRMWENLTRKLNDHGPIRKSSTEWQRTWIRLRRSVKRRKATYLFHFNKTGNQGPLRQLSNMDERVTGIFGKYGLGLSVVREIGIYPKPTAERGTIHAECVNTDSDDENTDSLHQDQKSAVVLELGGCGFDAGNIKTVVITNTNNRTSSSQKEALLQYMNLNRAFATNSISNKEITAAKWTKLAEKLNSLGTARSCKSWQKTWTDFKSAVMNRQVLYVAGRRSSMSKDDLLVLEIMSYDTEVTDSSQRTRSRSPHAARKSMGGRSRSPSTDSRLSRARSRSPKRGALLPVPGLYDCDMKPTVSAASQEERLIKKELNESSFIDLTNDESVTRADRRKNVTETTREKNVIAGSPRPSTYSARPSTMSATNVKTAEFMTFVKDQFTQNNRTVEKVLNVMTLQNKILENGFQLLADNLITLGMKPVDILKRRGIASTTRHGESQNEGFHEYPQEHGENENENEFDGEEEQENCETEWLDEDYAEIQNCLG